MNLGGEVKERRRREEEEEVDRISGAEMIDDRKRDRGRER